MVSVIWPGVVADDVPDAGETLLSHDVFLCAPHGMFSVPRFVSVTVTVVVAPCANVTDGAAGRATSVGEYATKIAPAAALLDTVVVGAETTMSSPLPVTGMPAIC